MADPKERLSTSVSDAELERRWTAVRAGMRERGIDYLVMQNSEEYMGGMLRWFTDYTARHQFPMTVIFPVDDDMTVINCGAAPPAGQVFPPPWFARGIKDRLGDVYFATLPYTAYYDAKLAVDVLKAEAERHHRLGGAHVHPHDLRRLPARESARGHLGRRHRVGGRDQGAQERRGDRTHQGHGRPPGRLYRLPQGQVSNPVCTTTRSTRKRTTSSRRTAASAASCR